MTNTLSSHRPAGVVVTARGFTLIELMVVMGIISLLVAIALPAFNAARKTAKRTTTEATISVLATALEQFNADSAVGGAYPPSVQMDADSPPSGAGVASPYAASTAIKVCGANLLVWGLAGADLLGTPGFRDIDGTADLAGLKDYYGGWANDAHAGTGGLYEVSGSTLKPAQPRSGPYVDLSKMRLTKRQTGTATFQIPTSSSTFATHAFLDSFDQPILYYRANPSAKFMIEEGGLVGGGLATRYPLSPSSRYAPTGIYNLKDNEMITGGTNSDGMDFGAGLNHFGVKAITRLGDVTAPDDLTSSPRGSFLQHLRNPNITALLQPQRSDSFILMSAGADGLFGTADDVANFPINK